MAAGAAGNLSDLLGLQGTRADSVEFLQRGERDMIDAHIDAHADGVCRHQEVHIAGLIERDLRVAGARGERAQHHRCAAALRADQIGDAIDILRRKPDHGGAPRQARQLLRARISEVGKPGPRHEIGVRDKALKGAAHRVGTEEHGFLFAARMQQAVGEDMAAFGIGAKLDFVDRQERRAEIHRHRFHRADEILRAGRNDLFFAGDQSGEGRAFQTHDLVVNLARQKPQRQADHAGFVGQHPLDGEMGLAGVGGPQNGRNAAPQRCLIVLVAFRDHRPATSVFLRRSTSERHTGERVAFRKSTIRTMCERTPSESLTDSISAFVLIL